MNETGEKKKFLKSHDILCRQIQEMQAERMRIIARAENITSSITGMPKESGVDIIQHSVEQLCELAHRENALIGEYAMRKREIEDSIDALGDLRGEYILRARYLYGHSLMRVAEEMHFSYRQVLRMHGEALRRL